LSEADQVAGFGIGMVERTLPDYDNPPAVETALGLRFSPIEGWNVFHYGALLQKFKNKYPKHELRPPIGEITFQFSPESDFSNLPVRCWFLNEDNTQLVQIQNNCFIRNWRRADETASYLHYDVVRPLFQDDWSTFQRFLEEEGLPKPSIWQCEVTYVNHFVRGREWHDFRDLHELYPAWAGLPAVGLFARPEMVSFSLSYSLPDRSGMLQFASQPGVRKADGAEIIQLTITALGKPLSSQESDIFAWLDKGRSAVVTGFRQFTSEQVNRLWGLK
jgi:uncharacterized protein (TIGR04255 family)